MTVPADDANDLHFRRRSISRWLREAHALPERVLVGKQLARQPVIQDAHARRVVLLALELGERAAAEQRHADAVEIS